MLLSGHLLDRQKKKDKLIYISMGTVNNDMMDLYKKCVSALEDTDYQVIMSVGNLVALEEFGELPENVTVFAHLDQIAVLEQADVFVSHCGMNSVSESLYFGVPLIMLPQTAEQNGVAERVYQLGAGIKLGKADASSILEAINKIFSDDAYKQKAEEISSGFKRCPGAKGAADKILQVCK